MLIFNCHCLACKKVSGSPMITAVVYNEAEVDFSGEMKTILEKFGAELEFYDNY